MTIGDANPVPLYGTPQRASLAVFAQPRRFPEYLRLQNIRERTVDVVALSPESLEAERACAPAAAKSQSGAGCDDTLARIGDAKIADVLESEAEGAIGGGAAGGASAPLPAMTVPGRGGVPADAVGRMIDMIG